jgi:hypothetical protein
MKINIANACLLAKGWGGCTDFIEIWNIQNKHGFKASRKLSCEISRKVNKTHEDWVPDGYDA